MHNQPQNRAARRRATRGGKPADRRTVSNALGRFFAKLCVNSTEATTADDIADLLNPAYLALTALQAGALDQENFIRLLEMSAFGFELAKAIHAGDDEQTQALLAPLQPNFEAAAESLAAIGTRKGQIQRFVAKAEELQCLRLMVSTLDQLLQVSTRGVALRALISAEGLTRKALKTTGAGRR